MARVTTTRALVSSLSTFEHYRQFTITSVYSRSQYAETPSRPSQLDVTTTLGVLSQILDRDHFAVITRTELCSKLSC